MLGCGGEPEPVADVAEMPSCKSISFESHGAEVGALMVRGHVRDESDAAVVGARLELAGDESAVRFSDLTGGFTFHVAAGTYTLSVSGDCPFAVGSVELARLNADTTKDFSATGDGCITGELVGATATGVLLSLRQLGRPLGSTSAFLEQRGSPSGASQRLQQIVEGQPVSACSLTIDGENAIERRGHLVAAGPLGGPDVEQVNLTTAIVIDDQVLRFESIVDVGTSCETLDRFRAIGRSFTVEELRELHQ